MVSNAIIPSHLQAVLWSVNIHDLDLQKDKSYIIHQIFSYGRLEDIVWLFRSYPKKEIIDVFATTPYKNYRESRFQFVKNYVLGLNNSTLNEKLYVKNTPRDLGYPKTESI